MKKYLLFIVLLFFSCNASAQRYVSSETWLFPSIYTTKYLVSNNTTIIHLSPKTAVFSSEKNTMFVSVGAFEKTYIREGDSLITYQAICEKTSLLYGITYNRKGEILSVGLLQHGKLLLFIIKFKTVDL